MVRLEGTGRVSLDETHRFANGPVERAEGLYWDAPRLFREIKRGLAIAATRVDCIEGIAVDTWGVDYALLDAAGELLTLPRHYRDPRTNGVMARLLEHLPQEGIYAETGIQFMPINTIYQLAAEEPNHLENGTRLLFMPDLINYWLTGVASSDETIASTSQLYDQTTGQWVAGLLREVGTSAGLMPTVKAPGTVLAPLREDIAREVGLAQAPPVILAAGHDTACAVAAVPATDKPWAYISSGTWSLIGVELAEPRRNGRALADGFTNEAGVAGRVRFLRNVAGLWLLQECGRAWREGGLELSYAEIAEEARRATPFRSLVDPNAAVFLEPGDMPQRIAHWCAGHDEPIPRNVGEIARCILESLALSYRSVLQRLNAHVEQPLKVVHIVGGGSQNQLLNQLTADACAVPVIAGPSEATVLGNGLLQALAVGRIESLDALRAIVRKSTELRSFQPTSAGAWQDAARRQAAWQ